MSLICTELLAESENTNASTFKKQAAGAYQNLQKQVEKGRYQKLGALGQAFLTTNNLTDRLQQSEILARKLRQLLTAQDGDSDQAATAADHNQQAELARKLLALNYGDLLGHKLLGQHYQRQGNNKQAKRHQRMVKAILKQLENSGRASADSPIVILTPAAAYSYAMLTGFQPLGGIYTSHSADRLQLVLLVQASVNQPHQKLYFSLDASWREIKKHLEITHPAGKKPSPGTLISLLARTADSAAKAAIGAVLARDRTHRQAAITWLQEANNAGNLSATLLLADLYRSMGGLGETAQHLYWLEQSQKAYLKAVAWESDAAMLRLGLLYVSGVFGKDRLLAGIFLLEQARFFGNVDATLTLAKIYRADFHRRAVALAQSGDRQGDLATAQGATDGARYAAEILLEAAELGSSRARLEYVRLQIAHKTPSGFNRRGLRWLQKLAATAPDEAGRSNTAAHAMLMLGWVRAKGLLLAQSFDTAKLWWRKAGGRARDSSLINEVAYTLVAIKEPALQDGALALRLMDGLMRRDVPARNNYAYLDTWASAYADNGQFAQAVSIQENAIDEAVKNNQASKTDLALLKVHLQAFRQGKVIRDLSLD